MYTNNIHGFMDLINRDLTLLDRALWFFVVLAFLALASVLTWDTWAQWRKNQVTMFTIFIHNLHLGGDHSEGHSQASHRLALSCCHHMCLWVAHGQCREKARGKLLQVETKEQQKWGK